MSAVEMREAAAALAADRPVRRMTWEEAVEARQELADAIRALPLPAEAALTPQEKLRQVREARELLATARLAVPRRYYVVSATTRECLGDWATRNDKGNHIGRAWARKGAGVVYTDLEGDAARAWVLDTLRADGWDVVEEEEADG